MEKKMPKKPLFKNLSSYIKNPEQIKPGKEAFVISLAYFIFGILWVTLSDKLLLYYVTNVTLYNTLQTYKGWLYVFLTTFLLFILIRTRMFMFNQAINSVVKSSKLLQLTNEKLNVAKEKLHYQAYFDSLTSLPNRIMLEKEINSLIEEGKSRFAVVYIDIDNFKYINDSLGHQTGDLFLKYIATKFKKEILTTDFVARQGGDEFAILFKNFSNTDEITLFMDRLVKSFEHVWKYQQHEFFVSISAGVALYPENGKDVMTIFKNADIAMYYAKKSGKDRYVFFEDEFSNSNLENIRISNELKYALENEQLSLYYQPQVNIITGEIIGVEALLRWIHPIRGFISPMDFIPLAEESGKIYSIDSWVVKTALLQKKKWEQDGKAHLNISINLSSKTLTSDTNFSKIENLLADIDVDYSTTVFEITETAMISDIGCVIKKLDRLKAIGIKIALDDFGTGYSSLSYLKEVPLNIIKLDQTFINNIRKNGKENHIIKAIISLARDLDFEVVAEGIETSDQLTFLITNQCIIGQGFLFSKAIPIEAFELELEKGYIMKKGD
ncbi:EAL domain-containing protein [Bacillaceae bacterium IKA-2]|nr:EAL domain-containing protein [Bacillaceae bacterium IKA-2]